MASVAQHQQAVRQLLAPLSARKVERLALPMTIEHLHRVLAEDLVSPIDHPPFDNSQMDGYAVRSADVEPGHPLAVAGAIAAGHLARELAPGTAAPIMTGAPVPPRADAIIPIERAIPDRFQPVAEGSVVEFDAVPQVGAFVRTRGSDLAAGAPLLSSGTVLGPSQWGVIAASGIVSVLVRRRVRVLVLSTGDELSEAGNELTAGKIYDANSTTMQLALLGAGAEIAGVATVSDDAELARAAIAEGIRDADLILTTGGVSKGAYEVVRDVFENAGVVFGEVAMQPGGPQGLGLATLESADGTAIRIPVVAFPGNPVSALVSFEMFLRPVLRELHGLSPYRVSVTAPLAACADSPPAKHQVRRARFADDGTVEFVGGPSSHLLHGYALSTLLAHVPVGTARVEAGDTIEVWRIDDGT